MEPLSLVVVSWLLWGASIGTSKRKITRWGYRDGVKRKGDKIGMDYTHGAVG